MADPKFWLLFAGEFCILDNRMAKDDIHEQESPSSIVGNNAIISDKII